jgi:hypothetical protein
MTKHDTFTRAYFEAMEWTDCHNDNEELLNADGWSDELIASSEADCADFQEANADDLADLDMEQAGIDFWLTRNRHGAGFWDRGLGDVGDRLTDAAHAYGSVDLYAGDDGLIYGC